MNGCKGMASGNVLHWEKREFLGRGGVRAWFQDNPPSPADIKEGQALLRTLKPEGAEMVTEEVSDSSSAPRKIVDFLTRSAENN